MTSIPNTLTIFINTRIRNNTRMKYSPSMTVPTIKSDVICFDPLIKLNKSVALKIPPEQPAEELYTQFFKRNEFNSLIQRTLANGSQRQQDLISAKLEGITDHNIRLILDILFKSGNPFYINGNRYTVHSYEWITGDWKIDTKLFEKYISRGVPYIGMFQYAQEKERDAIAKKELLSIPKEAQVGNVAQNSSKLVMGVALSEGVPLAKVNILNPTVPTPPVSGVPTLPQPMAKATPVSPPQQPFVPPEPSAGRPERPIEPRPNVASQFARDSANFLATAISPVGVNRNPDKKLVYQFELAMEQGIRRDVIYSQSNVLTQQTLDAIERWKISKNRGEGDCFFYAMRDILMNNPDALEQRQLNNAGNMRAIPQPNPYMPYTVRSLRQALKDYLYSQIMPDHRILLQQFIDGGMAQYSAADPSTEIGRETLERWRFIRNDADTAFLTTEEVADIIAKPSDKNNQDVALDGPSLPLDRYYLGDQLAVQCFEDIFGVKIVLITNYEDQQLAIGVRVNFFFTDGTFHTGNIKSYDPATQDCSIETDDYKLYNINARNPDVNIEIVERYSVYNLPSIVTFPNPRINPPKFVFMLYSQAGIGHYEAIYRQSANAARSRSGSAYKYVFDTIAMPGYIKYMIFLASYGYDRLGSYDVRNDTYVRIPVLSTELNRMFRIVQKKIANRDKVIVIKPNEKVQLGGAIGNFAFAYLQNSPHIKFYDTKLTYYIIIDLELYPGESIPAARQVALSCNSNAEKMKTSFANMFGLLRMPSELSAPGVIAPAYKPIPSPSKKMSKKGGSRRRFKRRIQKKTRRAKTRKITSNKPFFRS